MLISYCDLKFCNESFVILVNKIRLYEIINKASYEFPARCLRVSFYSFSNIFSEIVKKRWVQHFWMAFASFCDSRNIAISAKHIVANKYEISILRTWMWISWYKVNNAYSLNVELSYFFESRKIKPGTIDSQKHEKWQVIIIWKSRRAVDCPT